MELVQGTRAAFAVAFASDGNPDLTAATGAYLVVHRERYGAAAETWTMTIAGGATPTDLVATFAPTAVGVGSVPTIETLRMRPVLQFGSNPDREDPDQHVVPVVVR